jgi:hypothetical protein
MIPDLLIMGLLTLCTLLALLAWGYRRNCVQLARALKAMQEAHRLQVEGLETQLEALWFARITGMLIPGEEGHRQTQEEGQTLATEQSVTSVAKPDKSHDAAPRIRVVEDGAPDDTPLATIEPYSSPEWPKAWIVRLPAVDGLDAIIVSSFDAAQALVTEWLAADAKEAVPDAQQA